jgi:hypothetical protein
MSIHLAKHVFSAPLKAIYENFHFIALAEILLGLSILQISITISQNII